jgi:hypothetical protein
MARWIDRQRNILDFTFSSLLRRKGKNIALGLVYTLIVFVLASAMFLTYSLKREAAVILEEAPEMVVQKVSAGRQEPIPLGYIDRIGEIRGVSSVKGRLWGYYYDPITGANYTLLVPEKFPHGEGGIEIGRGVSRVRSTFPGDALEFRTYDGKVLTLEVKKVF